MSDFYPLTRCPRSPTRTTEDAPAPPAAREAEGPFETPAIVVEPPVESSHLAHREPHPYCPECIHSVWLEEEGFPARRSW